MTLRENKLLKKIITSQLNYSPLVRMCHNRCLNSRINYLPEHTLKTAYQDKKTDFETLLKNGKSVMIRNVKN